MKASLLRQEDGAKRIRILHLEDSVIDHDLVKRALQTAQLDFDIERVENRLDVLRLRPEHHHAVGLVHV